jgi:hypothetical protein
MNKSMIPLPGDINFWPTKVKVNQKEVVVLEFNNKPYVELTKGKYSINGEIEWSKRPEALSIPSEIVLLDLTVNNQNKDFATIERGSVWLGSVIEKQVKEKDYLKVRVNRLIADGHPMTMFVQVELEVSGSAREQKLTQFSLENYQLKSISSELNSRLDSQGNLLVQLKPGDHSLLLEFKVHRFPEELKFIESGENWPLQELWIYKSNDRLRSTQIINGSPIDSEQGLVAAWRDYPHYVMEKDGVFTIKERNRGMSHSYDSLNLNRQMWLSFDGDIFHFRDQINGSKSKDWRINTIENYRLTQLSNHGDDRLITFDENNLTGVEIRTPNIDITAGGEVKVENMQHVSGWNINFASTNVDLHIPPGRKLLLVSGADDVRGDWINQWKLIDLFFVLVIFALVFKAFGLVPSILSLLVLALGYHEFGMPIFLWFNLIIAVAIVSKASTEKIKKWSSIYQWASLALLLLVLLPFLAEQIRFTLHPQLEKKQSLDSREYNDLFDSPDIQMVSLEKPSKMMVRQRSGESKQKIAITGSRIKRVDLDNSYQSDAVIQAGSGTPQWHWESASYSWSGPVAGNDEVKLIILSEPLVKLWRMTLVITSLLWLLLIFKQSKGFPSDFKKWFKKVAGNSKTSATVAGILVMFITLLNTTPAHATDYPSERLLTELQNRLYPVPECQLDCVTLSDANISVNEQALTLTLDYQTGTKVAAILPDSKDWNIELIKVNGSIVNSAWRNKAGSWINLNKGISTVIIKARLKDKSNLSIRFLERPKRIKHSIAGWEVSGINQQRLMANALQLTKKISVSLTENDKNNEQSNIVREQSIEGLFHVERYFHFGTQWQLTTNVSSQAPKKGSINTEIPLFSFEQPISKTENVKNRIMKIALSSDENSTGWQSSLDGISSFDIEALNESSISESWKLFVFPNWNIKVSGVPAVLPLNFDTSDIWVYEYYPRAGERLNFQVTKPTAVKGDSVAITKVSQQYSLGQRKVLNKIEVDYRATRAEPLLLDIGEATLKQLTHDARSINLGEVEGILSIPLTPGEHKILITLESKQPITFNSSLNGTNLTREFSNLSTRVNLSNNRWLLGVSGPGYGPAVIYWGELIFFILLAIGLSRLPFSPLSYWQWLVLGLGMSTFSWPAMALVAAWLLGSQWRRQQALIIHENSEKQGYEPLASWLTLISTVIAVLALIAAVPYGLLTTPDMGVIGNGSFKNSLYWFLDHGNGSLGEVSIYSFPIWIYKGLMLLWATWLSFSLIKWLGLIWKDLSGARFTMPKITKSKSIKSKSIKSKPE